MFTGIHVSHGGAWEKAMGGLINYSPSISRRPQPSIVRATLPAVAANALMDKSSVPKRRFKCEDRRYTQNLLIITGTLHR